MQELWQQFLEHHEDELATKKGQYAATGGKERRMSQHFVDRRLFTMWIGINDLCAPEVDELQLDLNSVRIGRARPAAPTA